MLSAFFTFVACRFTSCQTYTELQQTSNSLLQGIPAWADDGTDVVLGVEKLSKDEISIPPLQGWWARGNQRFKLKVQDVDVGAGSLDPSIPQDLLEMEFEGHALSVYYMKSAGYALVNTLVQPQEFREAIVVDVESKNVMGRYSDEDVGFPEGRFTSIPSRDGRYIAAIGWQHEYSTREDDGAWDANFSVMILDTSSGAIEELWLEPAAFTMSISTQNVLISWEDDDTLVVTDFYRSQTIIDLDGNITTNDPLSTCSTDLPTTSGPYRVSDDAMLRVDGDRYVIDTDGTVPTILCA